MSGPCSQCVRRCRLLAGLGRLLDRVSPRRDRLLELLSLEDAELIQVLGGRRRGELRDWYASGEAGILAHRAGGVALCRHDARFPPALRAEASPVLLTALGDPARLAALLGGTAVAILDSDQASDYGRAMAASLGRGLAAAGVTVVAGVAGPIARAAHEGAAEAGSSLAIVGSGLATRHPAPAARVVRGVRQAGCAISELPWDSPGGRWGQAAAERTVVALGLVAVVIESRAGERELWAARQARALGRPVGALPGLLTNALAAGPHSLLGDGARLVAGAEDVLDLLHEAGAARELKAPARVLPELAPRLRRVLELVGAGVDTAERLAAAENDAENQTRPRDATSEHDGPDVGAAYTWGLAAALGELESSGLVCRSEQGRYVRRDPPPRQHATKRMQSS